MPFTTSTGSSGISTVEGTVGGDSLGGLNINKKVRLNALEGNDVLKLLSKTGETFNAVSIYGNAGTDEITTATAITGSLIQGGGGGDAITANTSITEVTVRGGSESDTINARAGGIKSIINGNKNNDLIIVGGNFNNSSIYGGDGVDEIRLQGGIIENTDINGDKGDDVISDQAVGISLDFRGTSSIYGNDGNDTIDLAATTSIVKVQGGAGLDTITGGTGNDILKGGTEDDRVTGGAGNDSIEGNLGVDILIGGTGNDTITGGLAADSLTGGANADQFVFTSGLTIDTVTDLIAAQTDVAAFSLAALEAAGATIAGQTIDLADGNGDSLTAGVAITVAGIAGATALGGNDTVLNYTAAVLANAAVLETALEAGGGIITGAGALAVNDGVIFQYTTGGGAQNLAIGQVTAFGAGQLVSGWTVTDIASLTGGIPDLVAAQYAIIA